MTRLLKATIFASATALVMTATMEMSAAQDWPTQPVRFVVGFPPGSSPDVMARLLVEPLSSSLGQPVIVENVSGAGGASGVQQMLRGEPIHTFGITTNGPLTTAPRLTPGITYDVERDVTAVSLVSTSPMMLVVNNDTNVDDLEAFIEWSRQAPGEVSYGSVGEGSGSHLATELFSTTAGLDMWHVPYSSFPEVTNGVLRGEINAAFMAPSSALEQQRAGNIKILGVSSTEPVSFAPDVLPIAGHAGMPEDFRADIWIAAIASTDTPDEIVSRLNTAISDALESQEIRERMLLLGWEAAGGPAQRLMERIEQDTEIWGAVIDKAGLGID